MVSDEAASHSDSGSTKVMSNNGNAFNAPSTAQMIEGNCCSNFS